MIPPSRRNALAQCLQESDCIMVQRHSAAECIREPLIYELPIQCQRLKLALGNCRRGMVDMRKRFRGNIPVNYKTLEGTESGTGYQLYGGKPAFAKGIKETSGDESIPPDWREVENEKYRLEQQQRDQEAQRR